MRWKRFSLLLGLALASLSAFAESGAPAYTVYVGTFPSPESKGIYSFRFDASSGAVDSDHAVLRAAADRPGYLALHPNGKILYGLNATAQYQGASSGSLTAYSIQPDGSLVPLNTEATGSPGPCYLDIDPTGRCALVAQYNGGSVSALPLRADGTVGPAASLIQHTGSSVDPERQTHAYAHWIEVDPAQRRALVCDLGLDQVLVYRLDASRAKLTPNVPPSVSVEPGSGPRHLAFHPNGRWAYVVTEMGSTVVAFSYDSTTGGLKHLQTLSTLPAGFAGKNTGAEIRVHPNGRYVYTSNRGDNSIAVFRVDGATGTLTPAGHTSTGGKTPRFFTIDPSGRWLLAANQDSNTIVLFRVDPGTGELTPTGQTVKVGAPTCLVFATLPKQE